MNKNRSGWFRFLKGIIKIFVHKPKFVYLGEKVNGPSIVLSNHQGAVAPVKWELYADFPFRFWGTYEMNNGLKSTFKYLKNVYFFKKKHFSKFVSAILAFFACPFANLFYKGLNLISTYPNIELKKTITESVKTIKNNQSLIIFPEDSSTGYHKKLSEFIAGFVVLANRCLKLGFDLPIYVSYYKKKEKEFIIDKPVMFSELEKKKQTRKEIAKLMCNRANELADIVIK